VRAPHLAKQGKKWTWKRAQEKSSSNHANWLYGVEKRAAEDVFRIMGARGISLHQPAAVDRQ
jgi:hypothetical protein